MPRFVQRLLRSYSSWTSARRWLQRLLFWGGAVAVGAAAVGFALAGEFAHRCFTDLVEGRPWLPLLLTPAGFALLALLTQRFFPATRGSGIPQTIAALKMADLEQRAKLLSLRIALSKMVLTVVAIFCGASVGREGPTVQVGASIMHSLGRIGRFSKLDVDRGLILAGGAAGVAAAFNTPLAGIVFAIEELSRSYEQRTNGTILTAVILAGVTSIAFLGNYTYFGTAATAPDPGGGIWFALAVVSVVCGLAGGVFARLLIASSSGLPGQLGHFARGRPVTFAAVCGLALALVGFASGTSVYGTGYAETKLILQGTGETSSLFGLGKFLATLLSYLSGIPGGIFAPSLAVGAGLGVNLAAWLTMTPFTTVVILAVVAYFAGVVQAPLTAFVIVIEMTDQHHLVLPLMAAALIGNGASRLVCRESLYKALADRFMPPVPENPHETTDPR